MKYLWLPAFLLLSCSSNRGKIPADLRYELGFFNGNHIHVRLTYKPAEKGSTLFTYGEPRFGGQVDIIKGLKNLKVSEGSRLSINESSREIVVSYNDTIPITIDYDIVDTRTREQGLRGELFRPIIMNDYIYIHGINLFLNPVFRNPDLKVTQSVVWKAPPPFRLFQSFNPGLRETYPSRGKPGDFMYRIITGASDMIVDNTETSGNKTYLVLRLVKNKEYNRKSINDYFTRYFKGITGFWNETFTHPFYLILQPFLSVDHSLGGMSLGNGFAGKYPNSADTILTPERIFILSQEIGRNWIGSRISSDIKEQWLGEGFNDYVTFYTLLVTGIMTPVQFEKQFNQVLESHYSSSAKSLPNDSIWANYRRMGDYSKLPYLRGCIFAFYLDNQIRKESSGGKSIRDLLLSLKDFCKSKQEGYQLTVDDFVRVASQYIPGDTIKAEVDRYIINGVPIAFSDGMLLNCFTVTLRNDIPVLQISDEKSFKALYSFKN